MIILLFAGGASALGFAPVGAWPLTLLTLALWVDRTWRAESLRCAFLMGLCFGAAHFMVGMNWIATAFTYQSNMPAWYGWGAVVLLSLYLALFPALAGAASWLLAAHRDRRRQIAFVFVLAAAWMLGEWLRATLLTGFAWDPIGVVWLGLPWMARTARWIGTYGLSGIALVLAGLLALSCRLYWRRTVVISALLTACAMLLGRALPASRTPEIAGLRVQVVQPNIDQDKKYDPDLADQHEATYIELSGGPGLTPRLLLWPEGATLRYLELEPEARTALAGLLGPHDLLLTGGPSATTTADRDDYIYHNSVFAMDANGKLVWRYDKAHLVPFGEYLPKRAVLTHLGLSRLVPGEADFIAGAGPKTFDLPGFVVDGHAIAIGVQICYEIVFSGRVVDERHRPSFLFNPSNDAWFGAWGPPQHLAQARMRAIEEGIPIVRATTNGISALIGPDGSVLRSIPRHAAGLIDAALPLPGPPTLFSRYGLLTSLVFGCALLIVGLTLRAHAWGDFDGIRRAAASAAMSPEE